MGMAGKLPSILGSPLQAVREAKEPGDIDKETEKLTTGNNF